MTLRRTRRLLPAVCVLSAFALGWHQASAQDQPKLTLEVRDAPISDVLRLIAKTFDINVVCSPEVKGTVTVDLRDVDLEEALDSITRTTGYHWERRRSIIEVTRSGDREEPTSHVFELKNVLAEDVREAIGPLLGASGAIQTRGNLLIVKDSPRVIQKLGELIPTLDAVAPVRSRTEVRTYPLKYIDGKEAVESINAVIKEAKVHPDPSANVVIAVETAERQKAIETLLQKLDKRRPQVRIEAQILETSMTDQERLGFNWNAVVSGYGGSFPNTFPFESLQGRRFPFIPLGQNGVGNVGNFGNFGGGGFGGFQFGKIDFTSLMLVIEFVLKNDKGKLVASPQISTVDNRKATITVGSQVPVQQFTQNLQFGLNAFTGYTTIDVGTKLEVLARTNGANEVTLIVKPEVSEISEYIPGAAGQQLPVVSRRSTETQILLKSGETLMIGGLLREEDKTVSTQVPFLGDIPLLGELFKFRAKEKKKTDLLVFLTPHVLEVAPETEEGKVRVHGHLVRESLAKDIEQAITQINSPLPHVRVQGMRALAALPPEADLVVARASLLEELLRKDRASVCVPEALRALASVDPAALARILLGARDTRLHLQSDELVGFALQEASPLLAAAAILLTDQEGPATPPTLLAAINATDTRTRRAALQLLPLTNPADRGGVYKALQIAQGGEAVLAIQALELLRWDDATTVLAERMNDPDEHVRAHAIVAFEALSSTHPAVPAEVLAGARAVLGTGERTLPATTTIAAGVRRLLARASAEPVVVATGSEGEKVRAALRILRERAPTLWHLVASTTEGVCVGEGRPTYSASAATITLSAEELATSEPESLACDIVHGATHLYLRAIGMPSTGHDGEEAALHMEAQALSLLHGVGTPNVAREDSHVARVLKTRFWLKAGRPW